MLTTLKQVGTDLIKYEFYIAALSTGHAQILNDDFSGANTIRWLRTDSILSTVTCDGADTTFFTIRWSAAGTATINLLILHADVLVMLQVMLLELAGTQDWLRLQSLQLAL